MIDPRVFDGRADTKAIRRIADELIIAPTLEDVDELLCELMEEVGYLMDKIGGEDYV